MPQGVPARLGLVVAVLFSTLASIPLLAATASAATPVGVVWTSQATPDDDWSSIAWGGPSGSQLFVAIANNTASQVMTSPDGVTWTSRVVPTGSWNSVTWAGPAGSQVFVAVASGGLVMTSPDGITWTSRTSAGNKAWKSVTWGGPSGQEKFVAVTDTPTNASQIMTSPDGITWTYQTSADTVTWTSVTWGGPAGNEKFVAVSASNGGNKVMTSSDGITWSGNAGDGHSDTTWTSVVWGGPPGDKKFVAVASNGSGQRVMTSPNGTTWTSQSAAASNYWKSVAWGGPVGDQTFVAVSANGSPSRVMTSLDGITWTLQTSPLNNWMAVTWGGPAGSQKFAAVASSGTGNRVMTSVGTLSVPGTPTISGVTASDDTAAVAFTADDSGGSTITRLEFALDDTSVVDDSTSSLSSPYTLSNLTLGTAYTVYMRAVNAIGPGPWSTPQAFHTLDVPGLPVITGVTPNTSSAVVTYIFDDSDNGGSLVTRFEFALDDTSAVDDSTSTLVSPFTLGGLTPATPYTVFMRAVNAIGPGPWSSPQAFTTVSPPNPVPDPPAAPTGVSATAGDASVVVSWTAPINAGSYEITAYEVISTPGGMGCLVTAPTLSCEVDGLRNGTAYTFTVRALSGAGWGASSAPCEAVTPQAPATPTIVISGSRDPADNRYVRVSGTSTDLVGEQVMPWVRFPGQASYSPGAVVKTVGVDGTFTWSRRTSKKIYVYFTHESIKSNIVTIAAP